MGFCDRADAGQRLAAEMASLDLVDPVVLGLPRGGVPVAREVARALSAPLDVLIARKVGAPFQPEFGIGAVAEGGAVVIDDEPVRAIGLSPRELERLVQQELAGVARRAALYRGDSPPIRAAGRTAVVADDGLATGVPPPAAPRAA